MSTTRKLCLTYYNFCFAKVKAYRTALSPKAQRAGDDGQCHCHHPDVAGIQNISSGKRRGLKKLILVTDLIIWNLYLTWISSTSRCKQIIFQKVEFGEKCLHILF